MIILDTNVISSVTQSTPEPRVVAWLDSQPPESIWTTSISVFEVRYGQQTMPRGKRRRFLQGAFEHALRVDLEGRVLDFDTSAADEAALISAKLRTAGRPVEFRDVLIAGIVNARHGTLATRNTKHFADAVVQLINP